MAQIRQTGRNHALVVVSEAVKTADGRPLKVRHPGVARTASGASANTLRIIWLS